MTLARLLLLSHEPTGGLLLLSGRVLKVRLAKAFPPPPQKNNFLLKKCPKRAKSPVFTRAHQNS